MDIGQYVALHGPYERTDRPVNGTIGVVTDVDGDDYTRVLFIYPYRIVGGGWARWDPEYPELKGDTYWVENVHLKVEAG